MPTSVLPALPTVRGRRILMVFAIVAALIFSTGSFTAPVAEAATATQQRKMAPLKKAVRITAAQKGDQYNYGSAGPDRFDCSGLTYFPSSEPGSRTSRAPRTSRRTSPSAFPAAR